MKKYFTSYWIRSAFFTILQRFSLTLFGFINFWFLIRALPKPEMGIWALFLTIITIFEMTKTNLLKNAHIKYVSGTQQANEKTVIASSSLMINLSITFLFILLVLAFAGQLNSWTNTGFELGHLLKWYIPGLLLMVYFSHLEAIQQSHLDFKGVFAGYFVRQVVFFGFIITHTILSIPFTLTHLVIYQTISIFLGTATIFFFSRPYLLYRFDPSRAWIRKIMGYGGYIFGSGMVGNIFSNLDQLMIAKFMSPAMAPSYVASYNSANRVNQLIDIPSYAASEVLFPKVAGAAANEGAKRIKYLYERMVSILMTFTIPLAVLIFIFPGFVITTIAGDQYQDAAPILQLYMITGILRPAQNQAANILNSIGRAKMVFYVNTVCLIFNCFVSYICLQKFGPYGPAIGTVITCLLGSAWWYFIMKKEIGFEAHNIIKHSLDISRKSYQFMLNFFSKPKEDNPAPVSKRIRIAYIISTNPHDKTSWSGISYYLGQAIKKNVGDVEFFWPIKFPPLVMPALRAFVKLNRILFNKEYKVQYSLVYSWFAGRYIRKQMKGKHYDCIIAPVSPMLIAFLKTDVPIVYFTDTTFNQYSNFYKREFDRVSPLSLWEGEFLERRIYKKSSLVIFTSHWASDSGINFYGIPKNKIAYLSLGANMDFTPGREMIFEKEKNPVLSLLFLGVDWERKGGIIAYDTLVQLNNMGINARLVICGCTPPPGISHPSMEVIPFLDKNRKEHHDKFFELLSTFHFLILPTRADCSSAVACEANAYGMPSLATITGGVPEVILDGVNGYCLPLEVGGAEFAKLIAEVFHDKKRYHDLIQSSRMQYEDCLNWDKWTDQFQILYKEHILKENKQQISLKPELC